MERQDMIWLIGIPLTCFTVEALTLRTITRSCYAVEKAESCSENEHDFHISFDFFAQEK